MQIEKVGYYLAGPHQPSAGRSVDQLWQECTDASRMLLAVSCLENRYLLATAALACVREIEHLCPTDPRITQALSTLEKYSLKKDISHSERESSLSFRTMMNESPVRGASALATMAVCLALDILDLSDPLANIESIAELAADALFDADIVQSPKEGRRCLSTVIRRKIPLIFSLIVQR